MFLTTVETFVLENLKTTRNCNGCHIRNACGIPNEWTCMGSKQARRTTDAAAQPFNAHIGTPVMQERPQLLLLLLFQSQAGKTVRVVDWGCTGEGCALRRGTHTLVDLDDAIPVLFTDAPGAKKWTCWPCCPWRLAGAPLRRRGAPYRCWKPGPWSSPSRCAPARCDQ